MSETQHTPGPLEYFFGGGTGAFIVEPDGTVVAKLSVIENTSGHSALVANARLFAAAPELLEACEGLLGLAERDGWLHVAVNQARAAIAKAKGEEP